MAKIKRTLKKIFKPLAILLRRLTKALFKDVQIELEQQIELWTWERYQRTERKLDELSRELSTQKGLHRPIPLIQLPIPAKSQSILPGAEKKIIHIGILFQIPSAWASLESVWEALSGDARFDTTLYLYDEMQMEKAQMAGARTFLKDKGLPYKVVEQYTFLADKPDILIYQTPWDEAHRPKWLQSNIISKLGIRVVYITYGLNYSASVHPGHVFSDIKLNAYPWLIFTFSDRMRFDHICLSPRGGDNVVCVGHPKFDAFAHPDNYPLPVEIKERAAGRKIVFIQIHFPAEDGNPSIPEADINAYINFLQKANSYPDFFFIVRPHPKTIEYYEMHNMKTAANDLKKVLTAVENVYWDQNSDYRPALFASDYVVGDRSALLIEAGLLHVPILYMTNYYYKEKMLPAVEPLFDSYYQGSFAYDIEAFLDMVAIHGNDYKRGEREEAIRECLPSVDGLAGKHIVDYIAQAICLEEGQYV